jgi:hypothetical protein
VADLTVENKVAAALCAYARELEQRARLIERAKAARPADAHNCAQRPRSAVGLTAVRSKPGSLAE